VLILGGIHGDLPIEPTAGAVVADLVVDEDVSVIIDISRHAERHDVVDRREDPLRPRLLRPAVRAAGRAPAAADADHRRGRPVRPAADAEGLPAIDIAECVGAIEQLVELGRNVGVGVALITQRSARMNKSVSELAEMMVAFRTVGPRSIDAILDWFGEHVPKERQRELIEQLRELDVGTALVVSPGLAEARGRVRDPGAPDVRLVGDARRRPGAARRSGKGAPSTSTSTGRDGRDDRAGGRNRRAAWGSRPRTPDADVSTAPSPSRQA
jgi:hypothetical protein